LVALVIAAITFFSTPSAQASSEVASANFTYVTVHSGETLWSIAEKYAPEQDPRDYLDQLVSLNNLTAGTVQPGQRIALPNN
jgi:LysM repeat protein